MDKITDDVLSYREMCEAEKVQTLQRGMNFRMNPAYSVILMSRRTNAPYQDVVHDNGTIEYEGHDLSRRVNGPDPKSMDQPDYLPSGHLSQNGKFIDAIQKFKRGGGAPELIKVYEKIFAGVWSLKGFFDLLDYRTVNDGKRNVFRFILQLSDRNQTETGSKQFHIEHTRIIPSEVKQEVWKRDAGKCVLCGEMKNLHFDHELPFSKGGTSLSAMNVRLLCVAHNLQKSDKIE